jgi:hypothetical protein
LDPRTQSAIQAIRSRRLRIQRRFARMLVSALVMALLGAGGTMLLSDGSNPAPNAPGSSKASGDQSLNPDLTQQVKDLNDAARALRNAP